MKEYYITCPERMNGYSLSWWKPNRMGYTYNIDEAGRYSAKETEEICTAPNVDDYAYPCDYIDSLTKNEIYGGDILLEEAIFLGTNE